MKKFAWLLVLTLILVGGVFGMVSADEHVAQDEKNLLNDVVVNDYHRYGILEMEDMQRAMEGFPDTRLILPLARYNSIEHWRWGVIGGGIYKGEIL